MKKSRQIRHISREKSWSPHFKILISAYGDDFVRHLAPPKTACVEAGSHQDIYL
jgi:hypothetical protein